MTTKTKICWDCKIRRIDNTVMSRDLCKVCSTYADHETMHTDDGHDDGVEQNGFKMTDCMICHPELDNRTPKQGHTNTVAKSRTSHAGCDHPLTPKARAACRKARAGTPACTCGGNVDTDGPVLIHSHKCPLKGTDDKPAKIKRTEANMRKSHAKVTVVSELPMPKLTPAQLASPTIRSMMK